jgi:purine-cytosine permease-like protein
VHAAFWRLTRAQLTFVISAIGLAAAYIALIAFNAIDSIEAFATLMLVTVSPWMVIMTVGHLMRQGRYEPMDLQAFAGSAKTGVYWFTGGFNIRAFVAWGAAVAVGMPRRRTTWRSLAALARSNRRGGGWELRFQVV